MFGEFARSAEAVFSRWAIKRVCKFLLKKKLGDLILGDIDLDQLDVQLGQGTIQLSDLALNVDYLNQKLTGAAVMVKEGSIGSLSMKIPWKLKNCQIEVEELELVLAPNVGNKMPRNADCGNLSHDGEQDMRIDADKLGGTVQENPQVAPMDVHEGVKTIAKIVKWLLTSFHVRLKNLIIAYDPSLDAEGKQSSSHRSLVLRISEVEYGTCILEDDSMPDLKLDCLLGIGKLTNFIKFEGVVVEFLQMDNIDNQSQVHGDLSTSFSEWYAGSSPSCCTATILTGGSGGGFSGKMNVSIPWKNGSVDFYKVDADISVNPVKVSIQKDTIMWIIAVWESLRNVNTARESHIPRKAEESSALNSEFRGQLDSLGSPVLLSNKATSGRGSFSKNSCSTSTQDTDPEGLLPCANVIQNWVPLSLPQEMQVGLESDYGASIDQFFECFDEFRSSQATLGNSGIWNWTCSVFSAITVASNLASGSTHIPTDQRHVETNIQASLGEISVILSFLPEEQEHSQRFLCSLNHMNDPYGMSHSSLLNCNMVEQPSNVSSADSFMSCVSTMNVDQSSIVEIDGANPDVHHLDARFQHVTLNLQIHRQKINLEASVMSARVDMFYDRGSISRNLEVFNHKSSSCVHMPLSESLQIQVQGALHPFPQHYGKKEAAVSANTKPVQSSTLSQKGMAKVVLFETFGACRCQYAVRSTYLDGRSVSSVSFIINLPPFVLWVHLPLVNILLNFCKEIQISLERSSRTKNSISDVLDEKNGSSLGESKTNTSTYITTLSESANTQGKILLPHARIVLCFPTVKHGDSTQSTSWSKFIVFEFSPFPDLGKVPDASADRKASSSKGDFCAPSTSIHANIGSIDGYLVTSQFENTLDEEKCSLDKLLFSAKKVFSMTTGTNDHHSGISMLWQKGPVTGPWMASRTWSMAKSHDQRSKNKVTGEGYEFSSVKTAEDLGETNSHIRQELVLSSAFFLHVHLSQVWINLGRHDYELLNHLLSNLIDGLPDKTHGIDINESFENSPNDSCPTQVSILVECDLLDLCINLDSIEISCSVQKELQGSWNNLRLTVGKFELLSVLNIGGIVDANFLWMNHGEGELRGSIVDRDKNPPFNTQDLLLISCSNSTIKRGDGEGANALSFGSAGTTITHIKNPTLHQIFTSITLQCGTFVVPGGRMDWISALSCFFTLPQGPELADSDNSRNRSDADDAVYISSFFLEFVDIALSFEPHKIDEAVRPVEESCEKYVACLLAAASLNVSHHAMANSSTNEYKFQLQDVGLLICESSGSKSNRCDYSIDYLRKAGFVKVAHEALVGAVLRIKGVTWEIECQEAHINLDSCSDTTDGLSRLVSQLQQLYAPDLEDALVHLQSRWNTVQQEHSRIIDEGDTLDRLSVKLSSENNLSTSSEDVRSVGLLDEIHENAFYMDLEHGSALNYCDSHGLNMHFPGDNCGLNSSNGISCDTFSPNIPHEVPMHRSELKPHIIDSYYVSDFVAPSKVSATDGLHNEDCKYKHYNTGNKDVECGNGRWYKDDSLMIVENHLSKIVTQPSGEEQHEEVNFNSVCSVPVDTCRARGRILLKNIDLTWRIYAGFDWCKPRENLLCGLGSNGRDGTVCLELKLSGLNLQYDVYPEEQICASKLSVSVQDFHLYDRSKDAPWKMVLGYYHSKNHPRESFAKAFKLDLEVVKPDPLTPLEEYRLHLELLPIRLHLDQSQLNFLIHFFGKDADRISCQPNEPNDVEKSEISGKAIVEEALLPFFQKCDVRPVVVRVDYIPRRVDLAALRGGNYAELLNLVPWKGIDLQLKHVCAVGVYGWNSICETVVGQWLEDISHNQVHKLLKGLPPIRSLYAVSSGASKLVSLPIKSYKKDHKLLKGMQRGARAFIRSISLEAVGLGVHLAAGAHEVLLQTEYILTSIPPSMPSSERDKREMTVRSNQPKDAQQGIRRACESISDGLGRTASALVGTPFKTYQRGGGAGPALVTAIRAAPAAAMAPVSASARAVHCALLGVRNSLDPEHKKESMEKYLGHQQ